MKIDDEIDLVMLQPIVAQPLFDLIDSDREHFEKWLPGLKNAKTVKDQQEFITASLTEFGQEKSMNCALYYKGQIVGIAGYNMVSTELKKVRLGYWLVSDFTGKGIMNRAVKFLIARAFNELGMEKVEVAAAEGNQASIKVIDGAGFKREGVFSHCELLADGTIVSHICFAIFKNP